MAQIETWVKCDLKKTVKVHSLSGNVFSGDNGANLIGVEILDNGEPASVTGGVTGYAIREDGLTVVMQGTLSGNRASVVLPASCYVVPGALSVVIKLGSTAIGAVVGTVYRTTTDEAVDPGHVVPSIDELLAKIADCEAATTAANRAASAIQDMTVSATELASGLAPTVVVSDIDSHKHITFGIPKSDLPAVTASDNGKVLRVSDGVWTPVAIPNASGVSF